MARKKKPSPIVLFEDNHLLGLVKPSSMLSQGDETGDLTILDWGKRYIKRKYQKPGNVFLQCVHRLDRPTSGVMILARTSKAVPRMVEKFREHHVTKKYFAITQEKPPMVRDKLIHYLAKDNKRNIMRVYDNPRTRHHDAKKAILTYELKAAINGHYLLDITLETGRSHQIRTQLSHVGCPILGDIKYGASSNLPDKSIALHSYLLSFKHPVQKEKLVALKHKPLQTYLWSDYDFIMNEIN